MCILLGKAFIMKTRLTCIIIASVIFVVSGNAQTSWQITGNNNTANNNFIGTTNNVAFKIRTNNIVRISINPSGNVGVGTNAPKSKLDVAGGITAFSSYFTRNDGEPGISIGRSGANYGSVGYGLTFTDTTDRYRYNIGDFSSMINFRSGGFDFNTAPKGTAGSVIPYTTAMTILENGNVGIGTLTPAYALSVTGTVRANYLIASRGVVGTSSAAIENTVNSNTGDALYIKAGSNTAAAALFIRFSRPDGTVCGSIQHVSLTSTGYNTTSDKRLKNIMGTTQKGLRDLMQIKVYDYSYKSDADKKIETGFMAQELYDIFPQAVSKPRENNEPADKNPWMVDYGRVTPLIIKAVQEQQQMIDDLKKQNEKLQKQMDELKALMIARNNEKTDNNATVRK